MIGLIAFFLALVLYYILLFLVVRFIFLYIRQIFRVLSVKRTLKSLTKDNNVKIEPQRSIFKTIFGNKGEADYVVTLNERKYLICIISFPYGKKRLRVNIDKAVENDFIYVEARFYSGFLYKNYKKANKEPDFSNYYSFETTFERHRLFLSDECCDEQTKRILLFVPHPGHLTYSDMKFKFLNSCDDLLGYKVMFIDDLKNELETN